MHFHLDWVAWAMIAMVSITVTRLSTKQLLYQHETSFVTVCQFVIALVCTLIVNRVNMTSLVSMRTAISFLSGIATGFTTFFLNKSYTYITNPGLPFMVYRLEIILSTVLSYLIFREVSLTWKNMIAMMVMLLSLFVLVKETPSTQLEKEENQQEGFSNTKVPNVSGRVDSWQGLWVQYAFFAALSCTVMVLTTKYVLLRSKDSKTHTTLQIGSAAVTMLLFYFLQEEKTQKEEENKITELTGLQPISAVLLLVVGLGYFGFMYALNSSMKISPNPGYTKSIVAGSTLVISFVSQFMFQKAMLTPIQWVSMVVATLCLGHIAQTPAVAHCH